MYFFNFYSILSLERDSDRERKIHNLNQQPRKSQEVFKISSGSQKGKKKKKQPTPHHTTCLLTYQVYTKGGDMGGAEYLGLESYLPCLEGQAHSSAQLQRLFRSFSSLMLAPNRGGRREGGEGRREGTREGQDGGKGVGREVFSSCETSFSPPSSPPEPHASTYWYLLQGSCSLGGTYLCEHVLLPSYLAKKLPCFHTSPCQP